jgi:hypothetical protein
MGSELMAGRCAELIGQTMMISYRSEGTPGPGELYVVIPLHCFSVITNVVHMAAFRGKDIIYV